MDSNVLQYLKDNLYIISQGDGYVISNKLIRELGVKSIIPNTPTIVTKPTSPVKADKDVYKTFIDAAEVPSKITTSNGAYWANRYSESGFKAFKKVFDDPKIDNKVLLAATKWYYKQTNTARKMIGTYFSEGIWESCYDDFVKAIQQKGGNPGTNKPITSVKIVDENASNMEVG